MDDEDLLWAGLLFLGAWWFYSQRQTDDGSATYAGGSDSTQGVVSNMGMLNALAEAIAVEEGFYAGASKRPARNHNPGDLKFAHQPAAIGQDSGGFAVFPDDASGWTALNRQLAKNIRDYPGYTLLQFVAHYLGQHGDIPTKDSQGDAFNYAAKVAARLGVPTNTTLAQIASGNVAGAQNA